MFLVTNLKLYITFVAHVYNTSSYMDKKNGIVFSFFLSIKFQIGKRYSMAKKEISEILAIYQKIKYFFVGKVSFVIVKIQITHSKIRYMANWTTHIFIFIFFLKCLIKLYESHLRSLWDINPLSDTIYYIIITSANKPSGRTYKSRIQFCRVTGVRKLSFFYTKLFVE